MNTNTPRASPEEARAGLAPTVTARTPPRGVRAPGRRVEGRIAERRPGASAPRAAVTGRYAT